MATSKPKRSSGGSHLAVNIGVALAGAAVGLAGGYFIYGKEAAKRRAAVRGWMLKAKGEILEKLEQAGEVSEEKYNAIIDSVAQQYAKLRDIDQKELDQMIRQLKSHWKSISHAVRSKAKGSSKKK